MLHIVLVLFFGLRSSNCDSSFTKCNGSITASYEKLGSNGLPANVGRSNELICYYLDYSGSINMTMDGVLYEDPYICCPSSDSTITFIPSSTEIYYTEAFVFNESYAKYEYVYVATSNLSLNFPLDDKSLGYSQNSTLRALGQLILLAHPSAYYALECSEPKCEGIFVDYEDKSREETAAGFFLAYGSHTTRSNTSNGILKVLNAGRKLVRETGKLARTFIKEVRDTATYAIKAVVYVKDEVDKASGGNDDPEKGLPKWALWTIVVVALIIFGGLLLWAICCLKNGVSACCAKFV